MVLMLTAAAAVPAVVEKSCLLEMPHVCWLSEGKSFPLFTGRIRQD